MSFDELQEVWQAQDARQSITINTEFLLRELRRNERNFRLAIFWRDVREVVVALVMTVVFLSRAIRGNGWPWYIMAAAGLWIALFMLRDRVKWKRKVAGYDESLIACAESSLTQVEHQIQLLKGVLWWYILPPGAAVLIMIGWYALQVDAWNWPVVVLLALMILVCLGVFGVVYGLNQWAVQKELLPRRHELKEILDAIGPEPSIEGENARD